MKWNMLLATLVLSFVCSNANAAGLLNQMLGVGCGSDTSCCQTPKCCTPKPRCCVPKPTCCAPVAATCAAPEPTCCEPEVVSCCKPRCTPIRDALHNLFSCRKSHCGHACEPSCAAPEAACCAPEATCAAPVACESCCHGRRGLNLNLFAPKCGCQRSCTPLRDAVARLFSCHHSCCDAGCGADCGAACGCGSTYSAPVEAGSSEADVMPPAPVPADTMTFVPARRRLASAH